jgi:predicted RNA-binding Zn-ribbon protein involved in translation (DUF1610 family)
MKGWTKGWTTVRVGKMKQHTTFGSRACVVCGSCLVYLAVKYSSTSVRYKCKKCGHEWLESKEERDGRQP